MLKQYQDNYEDNYISIDEAAEYLGIKPVTLRNWIKNEFLYMKKYTLHIHHLIVWENTMYR